MLRVQIGSCCSVRSLASASGWGMSGLWNKLRGGASRTEAAINRIKQSGASKTRAEPSVAAPLREPKAEEPTELVSPWDRKPPTLPLVPPDQLWMQSPFVRGSTQKMTALARQIIGLPLDAALLQMRFTPKKKGETVMALLSSLKSSVLHKGGHPAYYYVRSATVGRGTYLKRLDIKGRGRHGVQWRGHAFIRVCIHKPDPKALVHKLLRIKKIPREDRPITKKLDYY